MIKHLTGDILLSNAQAMAHGIAPNDHFDSGLALSLRQDWPALYKDFRHYLHTAHPKPGGLWVWSGADNPTSSPRNRLPASIHAPARRPTTT